MKIFFKWLICGVFCFGVGENLAAQSTIAHQSAFWTRYYLRYTASSRWSFHIEADYRQFFLPQGGPHQWITHAHAHRKWKSNLEAWGGMSLSWAAAQRPRPDVSIPPVEYRPWQALSYPLKGNGITLTQRLRCEERLFRRAEGPGMRFAFRARYSVSVEIPINRHFQLKAGDEAMFQWGENVTRQVDQNRLWAGLELLKIAAPLRVELLYMWQWQQSAAPPDVFDRDVVRFTLLHPIVRHRS